MAWKGRDPIIAGVHTGLGIPHKDMCPLIKTYSKFSGQKSLLKNLKFSSKRLVDEANPALEMMIQRETMIMLAMWQDIVEFLRKANSY